MKNKLYKTIKTIPLLTALMALTMSGCSYAMDYIEGKLRNRAAFSINASYDSVNKNVTITWSERGGDVCGCFAGYEVYMTEEKDDEYVGYILVANRHDMSYTLFSDLPQSINTLADVTTGSFTFNVNPLLISSEPKYGPGIYFFRIGIIGWTESDCSDRDAWLYTDYCNDSGAYYAHTSIDDPSGYVMLELY